MKIIDQYTLEHPTTGKRGLTDYLRTLGYTINVKRVKRLMDVMGIEWEQPLSKNGIRISMDGKGRCKDNIWIERFWRSIKQDYVYLHPTDSVKELRDGIDKWIRFYNYKLPHQGLNGNIPSRVFQEAA